MCKNLTFLAKASAERYIAQCEHGTIHLVWDNLSIRLQQGDFVNITADACRKTQSGLEHDTGQGFWLKMRGVALQFQPESLMILRDLMCLAVLNMDKAREFV
jgi:hypothetical protein